MLLQVKHLIYKELRIDWRTRYPVAGIVLYITSLIITSYLAFTGFIEPATWNALFWLIILFISINAVAKSFSQEDDRSLYYYHLVRPESIILAKLFYYSIYQLLLAALALLMYALFLGVPSMDLTGFFVNFLLGSMGLSSAFTMVSSIASKTNNSAVMMAILGFPVIIPILILAISNSRTIVLGGAISDISANLITLLSVNVIIIALTFILFPFIWK